MKNLIMFVSAIILFIGCSTTSRIIQPVLKENIEPVYPYEAKIKGIEGKVEIILSVNEAGDVDNTKISKSSGYKILDDATIEYAKNLKFDPASLEGKPVPAWVRWTISYKLEKVDIKKEQIKVLAFSKAAGFKHESIDAGKASLKKLAYENNFDIDFSDDSTVFNDVNLSKYNVVIFLLTTGDILDENGEKAFQKFIQNKGGFVGIHSATDTEYDWKWYGELIGTYFKSHPDVQKAVVKVVEKKHPSTKDLPYSWEREDEWYNFTSQLSDNIKVLAVVDESTYKGGEMGMYHPFCWDHEFDGGRCWYTAGGHTIESYSDPLFMKHILGGIKYAAGIE